MKNIYINIAFGVLISVVSMLPAVSDAVSFIPESNSQYYNNYHRPTPATTATQPITVVNNNYNNNINTYTPPAYNYAASTHAYVPPRSHNVHTSSCTVCTYRLGGHGHCGAAVSIVGAAVPKPTCTLVPAISSTGVVELQWTMRGATVAYIDNGIGHITTESGNMVITPQKDTVYNLTVISDAGISGTCTAKVNVTIDDPVDPVDPVDPGDDNGGWFGGTFRAIALPIGVAFLILIILLIVIMSKVKNSH